MKHSYNDLNPNKKTVDIDEINKNVNKTVYLEKIVKNNYFDEKSIDLEVKSIQSEMKEGKEWSKYC